VAAGIELSGDDPRSQASIGRQDLVGVDHRKPIAQSHDDLGLDPGELGRKHQMLGDRDRLPTVPAVVPVDPEEVERMRFVCADRPEASQDAVGPVSGSGELRERRKEYPGLPESLDGALVDLGVDQVSLQPKPSHSSHLGKGITPGSPQH
jgi:hypothetical protein